MDRQVFDNKEFIIWIGGIRERVEGVQEVFKCWFLFLLGIIYVWLSSNYLREVGGILLLLWVI